MCLCSSAAGGSASILICNTGAGLKTHRAVGCPARNQLLGRKLSSAFVLAALSRQILEPAKMQEEVTVQGNRKESAAATRNSLTLDQHIGVESLRVANFQAVSKRFSSDARNIHKHTMCAHVHCVNLSQG